MTSTKKSLFQQAAARKESALKRTGDDLPEKSSKRSSTIAEKNVVLGLEHSKQTGGGSSRQWERSNTVPRSKFDRSIRGAFSRTYSATTLEDSWDSTQNSVEITRPPRRIIESEKNARLLHPSLERASGGDKVIIEPGLYDSDSIDMRGVAHRLLHSTILPPDEKLYFQWDFKDNMNLCVEEIARVAQRLAVTCAQGLSVHHRFKNERILSEKRAFKQKERDALLKEIESLNFENEKLKTESQKIQDEHKELKKMYDALNEEHRGVIAAGKEKEIQYRIDLEKSKCEVEKLKSMYEMEFTSMEKTYEVEKNSLIASHEVEKFTYAESKVRKYRQSEECFNLKADYGFGFMKIGFYKARHLLEQKRGESFPELLYTPEIERANPSDWCELKYAPNELNPEAYLASQLYDDLSNLGGPWTFFGDHGRPNDGEAIGALEDLDNGDDDTPASPDIPAPLNVPSPVVD